ncbi:MAG: glycosyltransferase family 39 protein [Chloroflexi bacterium]|nr:glycosyltransferase family 39 protein [Chloroflexota bacterium]
MRRPGFIALLALCLVAFALRVFRLDLQSLWYDEAFSVYLAQFDLAAITARTAADIQPPLYYYLLHFWIARVGDSEFAVRFLSLIFGVATIPLLFVIAMRLFCASPLSRETGEGLGVGVIAALLATIAPLYVWYSQEARMYTLITFLLLLSSYALLRALQGNDGNWWKWFVIANIAAIYTHYFAFVVIAFQLLFTIYQFRITHHARFARITLYFIAILIAFLPWMPFVLARFGQDASYWRGALKLDEAIRHILINFTTGESVLEAHAQNIAAGWLIVLLVGSLVSWFVRRQSKIKNQKSAIVFLILYLLIPLALLLILFSRNPKFNARYLMIASPAFFLLLAAGLAHASRLTAHALRFTFYVLPLTFLLFTSGYAITNIYFDSAFTKADFRGIARHIEKNIARDEAIILTSGHLFPAFNYYFRGDAPIIRLPDEPTLNADHVLGFETADVLNATLATKRGVWVVQWQDEVVDPNGFVPMLLSTQGDLQPREGIAFWQVQWQHWKLDPHPRFSAEPNPAITRVANFGDKIKLLGFDSIPTPANFGATFRLYWHALDALDADYSIALRVRDANGFVVGKLDRRPAGYNYPTTRWKKDEKLFGEFTVPLITGAPPGNYFVEVTLYTKDNPSGLDVIAPNGAPVGKAIMLGPIRVARASYLVDSSQLDIQNPVDATLGQFRLLGYNLGRDKASAGETIPLTLFWFTGALPTQDFTFRIFFGDVASDPLPLAHAQFPTSQWRMGETVRGQYPIAIPADAKPGTIKLRVELSNGDARDLAPFTIEKTDRVFVKPPAQFSQTANFGNIIALAGYNLPLTTYKSNDTLNLTLFWHTRAKVEKPYTVFVHLLDPSGKVVAQKDAEPRNGARPTTTWLAGEYIEDNYQLPFANLAPGTYRIEIGWYDAKDPAFARLQVFDDNGVPINDHLILQTTILVQ